MSRNRATDPLAMQLKLRAIALAAELLQQPRRALDIREQKGDRPRRQSSGPNVEQPPPADQPSGLLPSITRQTTTPDSTNANRQRRTSHPTMPRQSPDNTPLPLYRPRGTLATTRKVMDRANAEAPPSSTDTGSA